MARKYERREDRLIREFLAKNFPNAFVWKRVRLGMTPKPEEHKWYQVIRRWADAVVYDGKKVYIIEAKLRAEPGAISQLELYGRLFPKTPEFSLIKNKPVELVLLTGWDDPEIRAMCEERGIRYEFFQPDWLKEYWVRKVYG